MDPCSRDKHRSFLIAAAIAGTSLLATVGTARAAEPAPPVPEATPAPAAEAPPPLPTAPPEKATAAVAPAETGVTATALPPPAAPKAPPPPYSIPWQLRPVTAATVLRSDTSVAFYDPPGVGGSGSTVATMLLGSYKLTPELAPMVRLGFVQNNAPGMGVDGTSFVNPIVGLTYAKKVNSLRFALFGGAAVPIGMGGGNMPDPGASTANGAGISARSSMDNAMFAVNYFTPLLGGGVAYVDHKLTVQLEATVLQLFRVRGADTGAATDSARTNSTAGIHVGYFVLPQLSFGAELRYQRWLSTPTRLDTMGNKVDIPDVNKDTLSFAIGPRGNFAIGNGLWIRPGISYARILDKPLSDSSYSMVQVDIPVIF
jgi:hypothetical protein